MMQSNILYAMTILKIQMAKENRKQCLIKRTPPEAGHQATIQISQVFYNGFAHVKCSLLLANPQLQLKIENR